MLKLLHTSDWYLGRATRAAAREQQSADEAALKLEEAPTFGTPGISERRTALEELRELACCAWLDNPASRIGLSYSSISTTTDPPWS